MLAQSGDNFNEGSGGDELEVKQLSNAPGSRVSASEIRREKQHALEIGVDPSTRLIEEPGACG